MVTDPMQIAMNHMRLAVLRELIQKLEREAAELQASLGFQGGAVTPESTREEGARKPMKRIISPNTRQKIADAQKKRWANQRHDEASPAQSPVPDSGNPREEVPVEDIDTVLAR